MNKKENPMTVHTKNVLAGIGTIAILAVAIQVGLTSFGAGLTSKSPNPKPPTEKAPPRIEIFKKYVKTNPPPADSPFFNFNFKGGGISTNFQLKGGGQSQRFYDIGDNGGINEIREGTDYTISELNVPSNIAVRYECSLTIPGVFTSRAIKGVGTSVTLKLARKEVATCIFTNTDNSVPTADLTIVKDYVPNTSKTVFGFSIFGGKFTLPGCCSIWLDDDGDNSSGSGKFSNSYNTTLEALDYLGKKINYKITERANSEVTTRYECTFAQENGISNKLPLKGSGGVVDITPEAGEKIVCTFTNTKKGYVPPPITGTSSQDKKTP